jgi:hypothetical protein
MLKIVVDNSNNNTCYSILSHKSEIVESDYEFMNIDEYKVFLNGQDAQIYICSSILRIYLFIFKMEW